MIDRRGWFAAAASLAAGLFALPGRAVAGLFRHRRCHAPQTCAPVYDLSCGPCGEYACTVTINSPTSGQTYSHNNDLIMSGTASGSYGGLTVQCELRSSNPDQDIKPDPVAVDTNGNWSYTFKNLDPPVAPMNSYQAVLSATPLSNGTACGQPKTVGIIIN